MTAGGKGASGKGLSGKGLSGNGAPASESTAKGAAPGHRGSGAAAVAGTAGATGSVGGGGRVTLVPPPETAPPGPVPAGTGWPGDVASASTPIATDGNEVVRLAASSPSLRHLDGRVSVCRACPRLVDWREDVARERRAAFRNERYWGRPIPGFGSERPAVAILGLAPAAHGGNRTGRIFTGDRSGDWLFAAMHRAGLASQGTSTHAGDGLLLPRSRVLAAVRCAPPDNKPTPEERDTCAPWLVAELTAIAPALRVVVVLGGFAWQSVFPALVAAGFPAVPTSRRFGHGAEVQCGVGRGPRGEPAVTVIGSYHPSQRNTFTGLLTGQMFDAIFTRAAQLAGRR